LVAAYLMVNKITSPETIAMPRAIDAYLRQSPHRQIAVKSDRLARSSFFMMATFVAMGIFGFGSSVIVARTFTPEQVGVGTSLISAASLIALLSLFGLNWTIVRFIANSDNANAQITYSLLTVASLGVLTSGIYVMLVPRYAPALSFVRENPACAVGFIVVVALSAINLLRASVFLGTRRPEYNLLFDGVVQGTTKVVLPFMLIGLGAYGVFASAGGASLIAVVVSILCLRRGGFRFDFRREGVMTRAQLSYSLSGYISMAFATAPVMALPLIALHTLGSAQAGYFYLTFQIANLMYGISHATGAALFSEGSFDESRIVSLVKRSVLLLVALQAVGVITVTVGSWLILSVFGREYAEHGEHLLQILGVGAIAVTLNTLADYLLKILSLVKSMIASNVVLGVVTTGLALLWCPRGLEWLGWAWLCGQLAAGICGVVALVVYYRTVRTRKAECHVGSRSVDKHFSH
jgi:O-antigen/teichoic acid export membrane protein